MKIYSVSTRYYYAFGAEIPHETATKMTGWSSYDIRVVLCYIWWSSKHFYWIFTFSGLKNVQLVLPDSYMNVRTKDYGGKFSTSEVVVTFDFCLVLCSDTCFIKIFFL